MWKLHRKMNSIGCYLYLGPGLKEITEITQHSKYVITSCLRIIKTDNFLFWSHIFLQIILLDFKIRLRLQGFMEIQQSSFIDHLWLLWFILVFAVNKDSWKSEDRKGNYQLFRFQAKGTWLWWFVLKKLAFSEWYCLINWKRIDPVNVISLFNYGNICRKVKINKF